MTWSQYHRLDTMNRYIDCLADDHRDKVKPVLTGLAGLEIRQIDLKIRGKYFNYLRRD